MENIKNLFSSFKEYCIAYKGFKNVYQREPLEHGKTKVERILYAWLLEVVQKIENKALSKEETDALISVGFNYNEILDYLKQSRYVSSSVNLQEKLPGYTAQMSPRERTWLENLEKYKAYKDSVHAEPTPTNNLYLYAWCKYQSDKYRAGLLDDRHIMLLSEAGFSFDFIKAMHDDKDKDVKKDTKNLRDQKWDARYKEYQKYKEVYGEEPTPTKAQPLYAWCRRQETLRKEKMLDSARLEALEKIEFPFALYSSREDKKEEEIQAYLASKSENWRDSVTKSGLSVRSMSTVEKNWFDNFDLYCSFKKEYGREPIRREEYCGAPLGHWFFTQKKNYQQKTLPEKYYELLQSKGANLEQVRFINQQPIEDKLTWEQSFELFEMFVKEHNRLPKVREKYHGRNVGYWMSQQVQYHLREHPLPDDKAQRLISLGVQLSVLDYDAMWEARFKELTDSMEELGKLPPSRDREGVWLTIQRQKYKDGKLKEDRISRLTEIFPDFPDTKNFILPKKEDTKERG